MAQNLVINDKNYLPSAEFALRFGYTPDYVSRLAREGKVVATQVGRKWFLEDSSFKEFIALSKSEKESRILNLKMQRKVERLIHSQEQTVEAKNTHNDEHTALAQSLAVSMCSLFVGLLGWTVVDDGMTPYDFVNGADITYTHIVEAIVPTDNPFESVSSQSVVGLVQKAFVQNVTPANQEKETHAVLGDVVAPAETDSAQNYGLLEFSDEVDVLFEDDGAGIVRPVFKSGQQDSVYRILLAPVGNENKN